MKVDPITLGMLLESMSEGIREMHLSLRGPFSHETVHALARIAHKLKGEATVVGLNNLSYLINELEDALDQLYRYVVIKKNHLRAVGLQLKKIVQAYEHIRKSTLQTRRQPKLGFSVAETEKAKRSRAINTSAKKAGGVLAALHILAQNVERSCGKRVSLNLDDFKFFDIPQKMQIKMQDILIQLIRNAITHGIETPKQRKLEGKSILGGVWVVSRKTKNNLVLAVRDNGQGVDLEEIRKNLVVKFDCSVLKAAKMTKAALLNTLFFPGFTTLAHPQEHAGRGVGLDLVMEHVKSLGGKVDVSFKEKRFTQFVIQIPLHPATASIGRAQRRDTNTRKNVNKNNLRIMHS